MNDYQRMIRNFHEELGIHGEFAATCKIPMQVEATDLVSIGEDVFGREQFLSSAAHNPWMEMQSAALANGIQLQVVSAFRSVDYQCSLIRNKLARGQSIEKILKVNAAPGYSEHHTGNALDLNTPGCEPLTEAFEDTSAFAWLERNAHRYGFVLSYPRDNSYDIAYEPWHWAYRDA